MKYFMLIADANDRMFNKPNCAEIQLKAEECERLDFTDPRIFRLVIDNKEHTLYKQYVFIKEKITIYVLNNY
jgi:hypothetical protein